MYCSETQEKTHNLYSGYQRWNWFHISLIKDRFLKFIIFINDTIYKYPHCLQKIFPSHSGVMNNLWFTVLERFSVNQRRKCDVVHHVQSWPLALPAAFFAQWRMTLEQQEELSQEHKGYGIVNVLSENAKLRLSNGTEKKTFPSFESRRCKVWG